MIDYLKSGLAAFLVIAALTAVGTMDCADKCKAGDAEYCFK